MNLRLSFLSLLVLAWLSSSEAYAAVLAIMPVRGVNLASGERDAIGMLFADAFARETHLEIITPMKTGPALELNKTSLAVAAQLEALEYIELSATRLDLKVNLAGIRFDRNGGEVHRAETVASSQDQMDLAIFQLARALAWRQPIPPMQVAAPKTLEPLEKPGVTPGPRAYPKALGVKMGVVQPVATGRSFYPVEMLAFDARFGTRDYFVELAAGVAISPLTRTTASRATMEWPFAEVGGSVYLTNGAIAPYVGMGISPRLPFIDGSGKDDGLKFAVYGQTGVTFTRDSRVRIYGELRVSQNLLGIPEYGSDGTNMPNWMTLGTYYPTEIALQAGVGW